ncbi:hypothetical protein QA612_02600 [Evansella sp. AB-P1]|uniref:hypothetical protein n=1 Tax=Evansella sp. AB-P1 TaxID=3037653 RepID=UPI00241BF575|nr:hypothetical protein [Evansella sp. AB-P1]MDG5786364.1 hypothetical protein [Evansella sp. AB-P1]
MPEKKHAFFCYGKNDEIVAEYCKELLNYAVNTLKLDSEKECLFYKDVGSSSTNKYRMMDNLDHIQSVILPAYYHLNTSRVLFYELYEKKFVDKSIEIICLDEEQSRNKTLT